MNGWGGDRRSGMRVDFNPRADAERDAKKAQRARRPLVRGRLLEVNGQRYMAYSAHELIEVENYVARPGHPVG